MDAESAGYLYKSQSKKSSDAIVNIDITLDALGGIAKIECSRIDSESIDVLDVAIEYKV